jgi:predicted MFS family arabinose efflux permease
MMLGVALLIVGATLTAGLSAYGVALVGFGMMGLAKSAYDPAMQTYISQRVPYARRSRALGVSELAWSAAWLGMPLSGWLIDHLNWRAPFAVIAALGLAGWWLIRHTLVADQPDPPILPNSPTLEAQRKDAWAALFLSFNHLWHDRHARLALCITMSLALAQDSLIVVYGAWMEDAFGLTVTALGLVSLVIGLAEAIAELGVALLSDRLGKRRAVSLGLALTAGGYLLLPRLSGNLDVALAGTAFTILAFEFSIVSFIPLISGLSATARGTLMSLNVAAFSVGRVVAAPLAVALYRPGDLTRNGLLSALVCLLSLGLLLFIREREH